MSFCPWNLTAFILAPAAGQTQGILRGKTPQRDIDMGVHDLFGFSIILIQPNLMAGSELQKEEENGSKLVFYCYVQHFMSSHQHEA